MDKIKSRFFYIPIQLALFCTVFSACGGSPAPVSAQTSSKQDELDAAIRETSNYLNKQLPRGNKLIILNVQSDFPALSEYIIDELIANTVNDRVFSVVDRQQLNTIRAELNFQMSSEVDDSTAQSLGRMAGAQIIISGAVSRIGDLYRLRVRALSVQSAQIEGQFNRNIPNGPTVTALVNSKATGYGSGTAQTVTAPARGAAATVTSVPVPAPTPAPAAPTSQPTTYNIGDKGPAGGIIFFDKGYFSDGWQYLEVASRDAPTAHWGSNVNGTREGIGTGKQNTTLIVQTDETGTTAHRCQEYRQGGYSDWFLPSKDELNLMYQNLKQKGLGGFSNTYYWSSSVTRGWVTIQRFNDGSQASDEPNRTNSVRACRQF